MGDLGETKTNTENGYESLLTDLGWSVTKDGSFDIISGYPRGNSFENRFVSQIWIDGVRQSFPLRCKIHLDRLKLHDMNTIEINGRKKQFRIIQKYLPHDPNIYNAFASQHVHIGGGQFIKPQIIIERAGYKLLLPGGEVFLSCGQLELLVAGKLLLPVGYSELSNIDGKYHFLVNPIRKMQQEQYRLLFDGKPLDDLRDRISIPTTSDFFRFDGNGGYFRITDSKSIRFDRGGNIISNQEFHVDFLDVLSFKVFAGFYPFFRRFTSLTTGTYRLIVDTPRRVIELKKI